MVTSNGSHGGLAQGLQPKMCGLTVSGSQALSLSLLPMLPAL